MEGSRTGKNTISISEVVYEGQAEQGVELDYILPDYCPEIFKLLCCRLSPSVLSYNMLSDSKLSLDGSVDIRVLYLAEGSDAIHCVEQRYTYSKTIDTGKAVTEDADISVKLTPRADYCNCRVVSSRRIDLRGAVSTAIRITAQREYSLPTIPDSIQLRSVTTECCAKSVCAEKQFTIREEIETGAQSIGCIIRSCAVPKVTDIRIIADKVVVKGIISINAAYGLEQADERGCRVIERMSADIPVSQILDIADVDESYSATAQLAVMGCELGCSADSGILGCNITAVCTARCTKQDSVQLPVDAYSTEYDTDYTTGRVKLTKGCSTLEKQLTVKAALSSDCGEIESVLDCSAEICSTACTVKSADTLSLTGMLCSQALCRTADGMVCLIEKQEGFEFDISAEQLSDDTSVSFSLMCTDADYNIRSDGGLDISAKLELCCDICRCENVPVLQCISIHEDKPVARDKRHALRICYANGSDSCWSIAKRCSAPVAAVMAENGIEDADSPLSGMVIIPVM